MLFNRQLQSSREERAKKDAEAEERIDQEQSGDGSETAGHTGVGEAGPASAGQAPLPPGVRTLLIVEPSWSIVLHKPRFGCVVGCIFHTYRKGVNCASLIFLQDGASNGTTEHRISTTTISRRGRRSGSLQQGVLTTSFPKRSSDSLRFASHPTSGQEVRPKCTSGFASSRFPDSSGMPSAI
jgi:hypothetical protein